MRTIQLMILTLLPGLMPVDALAWQDSARAGQGGQATTEKLAWRLKPGQKFNVTLSKTADITTQVDTRTRKVDAETTLELDWEVVDASEESVSIRQTLKRIRLTSGTPGDVSARRLDYDSAVRIYRNGVSGNVEKKYEKAIGLVSTFTLSPDGRASGFANDEGQEMKSAKLPDGTVKDMLSGQSAAMTVSKLTDLTWQTAPPGGNDTVVVKRPVKSELGDFMRVDRYRVKSTDQQTAINVETSAEGLNAGSTAAKVKRYQGQGSIVFNDAAGFMTRGVAKMTVASETPYRDMKIESLTEVQTTMTLNQQQ